MLSTNEEAAPSCCHEAIWHYVECLSNIARTMGIEDGIVNAYLLQKIDGLVLISAEWLRLDW